MDVLDTFDDDAATGVSNTFLALDFREPATRGAAVLCFGGGDAGMMSGRSSSKASSEKSGGGGEYRHKAASASAFVIDAFASVEFATAAVKREVFTQKN